MGAKLGSKSTISEGLALYLDAANPSSAKTFDTLPAPWSAATAPDNSGWNQVTYGNGKFVAIAQSGGGGSSIKIMYASESDLTTWTGQSTENQIWYDITYGNGYFVAVSNNGTNRVMYASDSDLTTWTLATAAEQNDWKSVTYGNGKFVAVSDDGTNRVMYASDSDPSSWTSASASEASSWWQVTYGNGKFVAVAASGTNRVMYSSDAINWTSASNIAFNAWYGIAYGGGKFVAVAGSGINRVMHSSDGINWTNAPSTNYHYSESSWRSVTYGKGVFVAVAASGTTTRVMYSYDGGIHWSAGSATEDNQWLGVTYANDTFVAVSNNGTNRVMYSRNITSPTLRDLSLNKITGSLYNSPTFSNTGPSSYIELNTGSIITDQYYNMKSSYFSELNFAALNFSIEFWINRYDGYYILDQRVTSVSTNSYITFNASQSNKLSYRPYNATAIFDTATNNPTATDTTWTGWRHYVISREGTGSNQCKLYYNGSFVAQGTDSNSHGSPGFYRIGVRSYDNASPFKGRLGLFKVYKGKALSAAEVLQSYNDTKGRYV